jgi:hypothetical protein
MRTFRLIPAVLALCASWLVWPGLARADGDSLGDALDPRAIGAGEALRASAVSGASTSLNPAGAGLTQAYVLSGTYGFRPKDSATVAGGSVCDSVTSGRLAACAYYTYFSTEPTGGGRTLHDVGLTLALPLADKVLLGATTRYVNYTEKGTDAMPADGSRDGAVVMDFGAIVRLTPTLDLGAVGYNMVGHDTDNFPRGIGTGIAFHPIPALQIGADGVWNLDAAKGTKTGRYGAGAEYFITGSGGQQGYPIRAGYVYDAKNGGSYLTAGLGFATPRVAIDAGLRKQVAGDQGGDELIVEFGLRVFMPSPGGGGE